ncbi:MAG: ArsR/SmtB family transcription factor, partial [Pseudonocardia sp.]
MTADQVSAEQPPDAGQPAGGGADEEVGIVLVALADPTRRQLLNVLVHAGRASPTTLAARLPVTRQAVTKHLQVLESAGLVQRVRVGREVLYSA